MFDLDLALITGVDIPVPECQLVIHQPTIKEISLIGEKEFFTGAQLFCINKQSIAKGDDEILKKLNTINDFTLVNEIIKQENKKDVFLNFLTLMFPQYKIILMPRSINFMQDNQVYTIDENNFTIIRDVCQEILCLKHSDDKDFNPMGEKAKEIAKKLYRARERVAAQKQANGEKSSLSQYVSVITVALGSMSLNDSINLTLYQLYDLINRYGLYVNYDLDIKARLAGAGLEKQPDNWMKSIH